MDMGRRCEAPTLSRSREGTVTDVWPLAGVLFLTDCPGRTYTYEVGTPHMYKRGCHMLNMRQVERLMRTIAVPGLPRFADTRNRAFPHSACHMTAIGQPPAHPCTRVPVFLLVASFFAPLHMGLVSLCIHNRPLFIKQASRSVYGCCAPSIRSNSTVSIPTWRHAALSQRFRPSPIAASHTHLTVRAASWATKFNLRRTSSSSDSDAHEEAAKAAVLEAIKGRQQTDLMLRCESAITTFLSPSRQFDLSPHRHRS